MKFCAALLLTLALPVWGQSLTLKTFLIENRFVCVRAGDLTDTFLQQFSDQFRTAVPTNQFAGMVLDLRQAGGTNLAGIADFLLAKKIPLVVLTDTQTREAATNLAGQLHAAGAVVIDCQTDPSEKNLADLRVRLSADEERRFLENPFTNPAAADSLAGATNLMYYVDHTSEAELVRQRVKDGDEDNSATPRTKPAQPVITDPALARAVDLLKALAVLPRVRG
jgi:hypothetical protein